MRELSFNKRVNIFCGHYGSGKSEISVNAALAIRKNGEKEVFMADLDIVNPFFRSLDAKRILESDGIKVIAPMFANTNVDIPALIPEISAALRNKECKIILDVGGDEDGARVLGRYHQDIPQDDYDMFFVINRARPMTQNTNETIEVIREIEAASRRKITKLINNTHFLDKTTIQDVLYGLELAREVSEQTKIPLAANCIMEGMENQYNDMDDVPIFIISKNITLPF
jgi:hypothetical protein